MMGNTLRLCASPAGLAGSVAVLRLSLMERWAAFLGQERGEVVQIAVSRH